MQNVIKLGLVVVLLGTFTSLSTAQSFGIKAGFNLSDMKERDDDLSYDGYYKMRPGFHVGAGVEFDFNSNFSLEPSLLLTSRGFRVNEEETVAGDTYKLKGGVNLLYLNVPVLLKGYIEVGNENKIYVAAGPYAGIGLNGKIKMEVSGGGTTYKDDDSIHWGSNPENDDIKRLDYGLSFGAGVMLGSFQAGVSYDLGLSNNSNYLQNGYRMKNRVLSLSLAFYL